MWFISGAGPKNTRSGSDYLKSYQCFAHGAEGAEGHRQGLESREPRWEGRRWGNEQGEGRAEARVWGG